MKKGIWHRRIPTLIAVAIVLFIFASIWTTSFLIQKGVIFEGRAKDSTAPQNITVSNVTDSSFTVSFTTSAKVAAALSIEGEGLTPFVALDVREESATSQKEFFSHLITVSNLAESKKYEFSIISGQETYLSAGQKFQVTTAGKISGRRGTSPQVTGRILKDATPAGDTVVSLSVSGGKVVAVLTKDDGSFSIPTDTILNASLTGYRALVDSDELTITATSGDAKSVLKILFKDAKAIPAITLGQSYDFTEGSEPKISTSSSQLKIPKEKSAASQIAITIPSALQSFIDARPRFTGTAIPNQDVKVTIGAGKPVTVKTDNSGFWSFRPAEALPPGLHAITIITPDNLGILRTVSSSFSIFPSGSQVTQEATPSATPAQATPTPTRAPTPSPTRIPTGSATPTPTPPQAGPTATTAPTTAPTSAPTVTAPSPTQTPAPTTVATTIPTSPPVITPPPPGSNTNIVLTAIAFILIVAGGALLFLL